MIFAQSNNNIPLFITVFLLAILPIEGVVRAESEQGNNVVIYQVQTGDTVSVSHELITLYNNTDLPVDMSDWTVVYASASGQTVVPLVSFQPKQPGNRVILMSHESAVLATKEYVAANQTVQPDYIFNAGLSASGGHVRLLDNNSTTIDVLGYGTASLPEHTVKAVAPLGRLLQRKTIQSNILQDSNNNIDDFIDTAPITLRSGGIEERVLELESQTILVISEILPNPDGADSGQEFVEIFNPNVTSIDLSNYSLSLGPGYSKKVVLPKIDIAPQAYLALSDSETGLTLPNTIGSLRLYDKFSRIIDEVGPYENVEEGLSWARFGVSEWKYTYNPTPGYPNEFVEHDSCDDLYVWSIESKDCIKLATVVQTTLCPIGQERNIDTGRCRKLTTKAPSANQCAVGQKINASTGRCKKIESIAPSVPCPIGQERSLATNRCKKMIPRDTQFKDVKDIISPAEHSSMQLWAAGAIGTGSIGYVVYEWREDLQRRLRSAAQSVLSRVK